MLVLMLMAALTAGPSPPAAPKWEKLPAAEDMMRFYPEGAAVKGVEGRATVECTVNSVGGLDGCSVVSEEPSGEGFGAAVLSLSVLFKMSSHSPDGRPTEGGVVRVPVAFRLPALGAGDLLLNPDWIRRPTGQDFATVYPEAAQRRNVSGGAVLQCIVSAKGTLVDCQSIYDAPAALGFDRAVLKLSRYFLMKPLTKDGVPTAGRTVRIPMGFKIFN